MIAKTEAFLKKTLENSEYLRDKPEQLSYRLEHSYRVANVGKAIAQAEGFSVTDMVMACLLHDISYSLPMDTREQRLAHGRLAAQIARPFLESLGLEQERVNDMLYGIAIHVDDQADFEWRRTAFAETISDADNIDRFDVYRIYESLEYNQFSKLPLGEKQKYVEDTLSRLQKYRQMPLATAAATTLWQRRIDFYLEFYEKLESQLKCSQCIL